MKRKLLSLDARNERECETKGTMPDTRFSIVRKGGTRASHRIANSKCIAADAGDGL